MTSLLPINLSVPDEATTLVSPPLYLSRVPAGMPSPAGNDVDGALDLFGLLVRHPADTFFCQVAGDSMEGAGIFDGDILIVDRAVKPLHGDVVVAAVAGEVTCKYLDKNRHRLLPANDKYRPIELPDGSDLVIEGVVVHSIRCHRT